MERLFSRHEVAAVLMRSQELLLPQKLVHQTLQGPVLVRLTGLQNKKEDTKVGILHVGGVRSGQREREG